MGRPKTTSDRDGNLSGPTEARPAPILDTRQLNPAERGRIVLAVARMRRLDRRLDALRTANPPVLHDARWGFRPGPQNAEAEARDSDRMARNHRLVANNQQYYGTL